MPPNCAQMLAVVTECIQWQTMLKLFTEMGYRDGFTETQCSSSFFFFFLKKFYPKALQCLSHGRVCVSQVDSVFHTGPHKPRHLSKHTDVALTCR